MSDPFVGEIRMFAGKRPPENWMFCHGQLLTVEQYDALYTLVGNTYGGSPGQTFGLPDLRGRVPVHLGTGHGLTHRTLGATGGSNEVTLKTAEIPAHAHAFRAQAAPATETAPKGAAFAKIAPASGTINMYEPAATATAAQKVRLASSAILETGGGRAHENRMPSFGIHFMICVLGTFPEPNTD